jgi:hypothetical protein
MDRGEGPRDSGGAPMHPVGPPEHPVASPDLVVAPPRIPVGDRDYPGACPKDSADDRRRARRGLLRVGRAPVRRSSGGVHSQGDARSRVCGQRPRDAGPGHRSTVGLLEVIRSGGRCDQRIPWACSADAIQAWLGLVGRVGRRPALG